MTHCSSCGRDLPPPAWYPSTLALGSGPCRACHKARKRNKAARRRGTIYVVLIGPFVKIGYSENVPRRLSDLQSRAWRVLRVDAKPRVIMKWAGTMQEELQLHEALAQHRVAGHEWYSMDVLSAPSFKAAAA